MRRLLLLLMVALPMLADDDITRLKIVVTDQDGKPVDRASVIVKFIQGRSVTKLGAKIRKSYEMKSSQEGIARVPSIPQGKILVQISAKNFQTFGQTFDVQETERTIDIKLNPPQSQYSAHEGK